MSRSWIVALLALFGILFIAVPALAWTGPTGSPPSNNVSAPVNIGGTYQEKTGSLWVDGGIGLNSGSALCLGSSCITSWAQASGGSASWTGITGKPYPVNGQNWSYSGQSGQPSWLWGTNDGTNMYVWNPSNFSVNYANSAGSVAWSGVSGKPYPVNGQSWNWSGQGGQPSWLWGSNDGTNMYVWNPSNFSVNYANSAGTASNANALGGVAASNYIQFNTWQGSNYFATNGDIYMPWAGQWLSQYLSSLNGRYSPNQNVNDNSVPQFARIYDDNASYYIDSNTTSVMADIYIAAHQDGGMYMSETARMDGGQFWIYADGNGNLMCPGGSVMVGLAWMEVGVPTSINAGYANALCQWIN